MQGDDTTVKRDWGWAGKAVRSGVVAFALLLPVVCSNCAPRVRVTPPPAAATAEEVALAGAAVLIGAGDIARCGTNGDERTAALVDSMLVADSIAKVDDAVFGAGDLAYPNGSAADFRNCWGSSWGSPRYRINRKIFVAPGNHDYRTARGAPYYAYFGERAGPPGRGYFSFKLGEWHVVMLNSEIVVNGNHAAERAAQEAWLRQDLEDNPVKCTVAIWHHPVFSSSYHGEEVRMRPIFRILYERGVDLVITGHDHTYERFVPLNPSGVRDTARGIVQLVVGTGGAELRGFRSPNPGSAARVQGYYGVVKITLGAGAYQHAFIDVDRRIWDPGSRNCH